MSAGMAKVSTWRCKVSGCRLCFEWQWSRSQKGEKRHVDTLLCPRNLHLAVDQLGPA